MDSSQSFLTAICAIFSIVLSASIILLLDHSVGVRSSSSKKLMCKL